MNNFDITWITAIVSIIASYLNIKKKAICFYLWGLTVIVHFIIDIGNKQYGRSFLDIFLLGINIYGIIAWTKKEETKNNDLQVDS
ncbi:MAG: nicotinamide mononucleotide transporter family protein [Endomicrobium sp.]|jgi:nicotinamide riboside transporter PnuC|nr:nicotinamide mononucleotide transporter family protein [Endomicrobium sp.]